MPWARFVSVAPGQAASGPMTQWADVMRKLTTLMAAAALVLAFGFAGTAVANHAASPAKYGHGVADWGRTSTDAADKGLWSAGPHGDNSGPYNATEPPTSRGAPQLNTLGERDGKCTVSTGGWLNLGDGTGDSGSPPEGFVIVRFDNNIALPGSGGDDDINVWEACSSHTDAENVGDVEVSADGFNGPLLGARDSRAGARGEAHATALREALCEPMKL